MMRHDPLNPIATVERGAIVSPSGAPVKVTLSDNVGRIPASTFACLLGNADTALIDEARKRFAAYCERHDGNDWRDVWRQFVSAVGVDHGSPALKACLAEKAAQLRQFRPLNKVFPAALRRVLRAHDGHLAAFERAIAGIGNYSARFENNGFLPLCVEVLPAGMCPAGVSAVSVAHYGEQNGDAMRDPEIVFAVLAPDLWLAYECTQDYVGSYSTAFRSQLFHPRIAAGINMLANVWARNLGGQGWQDAKCARANLEGE